MKETKAWSEGRAGPDGLHVGRVVQQAVRHEKEHRHQLGNPVEIAHPDGRKGDDRREHDSPPRVAGRAGPGGEEGQRLKESVAGQGLQDSRCPQERRQRRRERGGEHTEINECRRDRDPLEAVVVARQLCGRNRCRQYEHGGDVHHGRHPDGSKRAERQAACWIFEIAGHADALGKPGYRGEEDCKDRPELEPSGALPAW